jgi:hypothetical protein
MRALGVAWGAVAAVALLAACLPPAPDRVDPAITTRVLDAPDPGTSPETTPDPETTPEAPADAEPLTFATPTPVPLPPALRAQEAECARSGGRLVRAGRAGLWTCQRMTRDSGQRCARESDCEGMCLARTNTCAPAVPLFGCHEVLDSFGRRNRLCVD